jgi:hypothetical protein
MDGDFIDFLFVNKVFMRFILNKSRQSFIPIVVFMVF